MPPSLGERQTDLVSSAPVRIQRRFVGVLALGQALQGVGQGSTLAVGAVIAADLAGEEFSGAAATASTLGAALASIPLARLAVRRGRRPALALGASLSVAGSLAMITATGLELFPLLVLGFLGLGVGTAVGLQARFAATDAAEPTRRGRDLSIVVWSTTIGAVAGPNLIGPGAALGDLVGLPERTGSFAIALAAQLVAVAVYLVALRPDPLEVARSRPAAPLDDGVVRSRLALGLAIAVVALSHAVMVSVMAMTPVHLTGHGASLTLVGVTISLHVAGMYALAPVFGLLSDRAGRVPTVLLGQAVSLAAVVLVGVASQDHVAVTVALVLLGLGWSAATVAGSALVADLATGATRVRMQGRSDTLMSLSGAAGGAAAGPVLALIGYSGLGWAAAVLVLLAASAAVVVGIRIRPS